MKTHARIQKELSLQTFGTMHCVTEKPRLRLLCFGGLIHYHRPSNETNDSNIELKSKL